MTPARRTFLLLGLLGISASLVAWDRLRTPSMLVADAVPRKAIVASPTQKATRIEPALSTLRERSDYLAKGQDAFPPLLPPPPPKPAYPASAEPPRPTPPPVPFTVIGKKLEGTTWEVYLARGDQTYIATQGGDLAGVYRVDAINPTQITLIYLPLNEKQTLQTGASLHD
jgi:hypothetical protein